MSGFLLCWNRGGGPVSPRVVAAADAWRPREGAPPPRRLLDDDAAAWHWPGAWAPGAEEALPLDREGWIGSGVVRLDDRDALASRLRDAGIAGPDDDASLVWRSLAAWGDDAAGRWIGDYSIAAVAPRRERLVAARGIVGVRPCFHASAGALDCVSDDLDLLISMLDARREPAEQAIAEYLRFGQLMSPTLTFHQGVTRVPAAHTLVIERDGTKRLRRHWDFPQPGIRHGRTDEAVIEEFHDVLGASVRDRLRGPGAAILLSGGLDSSALAVTARRTMPGAALHAVTVSWSRMIADDEAALARLVAEATGIPHEVWEYSPDEGLLGGTPFRTPEPVPDPEPRVWRAQAARLQALAPVVLIGEDVDALLTPPTLLSQLRDEGVGRTVRAWRAWRGMTGVRPWIGARRSILALERWRDRRQSRPPNWLRPEIVARHPAPAIAAVVPHPTRALAVRSLAQPTWDATCWLEDPGMSGADVVALFPFMDPRVIRFVFSLPAVPWTQRKHLLRRAFVGALPPALLDRAKTPVHGYYDARVRVWRGLGAPAPLPAPIDAWVDRERWRHVLADATRADDVFAAWRVLELSRWLAQPARVP